MIFSSGKQHVINDFKDAVSNPQEINLDRIDTIISDQNYREKGLLNSKNTEKYEQIVLGYMLDRAQKMIATLDDEKKEPDLEGLSHLTSYQAWSIFNSPGKQAIEGKLKQYYVDSIKDLKANGKYSSAFRRVNLFRKTLKVPDLAEKLEKDLERAKFREKESEKKIRHAAMVIEKLARSGRFDDAELLLDRLVNSFTKNSLIENARKNLSSGHRRFNKKLKDLKSFIQDRHFEAAAQKIQFLQTDYSPDMDDLESVKEDLKKTMVDSCLDEIGNIDSPLSALEYVQNQLKTFQALGYDCLSDVERKGKIVELGRQVRKVETDAVINQIRNMEYVEALKGIETIQNRSIGQWIKKDARIGAVVNHIHRYQDSTRDLDARKNSLTAVMDTLGLDDQAQTPLQETYDRLNQQAKTWNLILSSNPPSDPDQISAHIKNELQRIMKDDCGKFHDQARKAACENYNRMVQIAANKKQWDPAVDSLKTIRELDPDFLDCDTQINRFESSLKKERQWFASIKTCADDNQLQQALDKIIPLIHLASVAPQAKALEKELIQRIKTIEKKVETTWNQVLPKAQNTLYRLEETDLNRLKHAVDDSLDRFRDSKFLLGKKEILKNEIRARGYLDHLESAVKEMGHPPGLAKLGPLVETAREYLEKVPSYPPILKIVTSFQNEIKALLVNEFNDHMAARRLLAALGVAQKKWSSYLGNIELSEDIQIRMKDLEQTLEKAEDQVQAAEVAWNRHRYESAARSAGQALDICSDHGRAIAIKDRFSDWKKGIQQLGRVEQLIHNFDQGAGSGIDEARDITESVRALPVSFIRLKDQGLRWNSLEDYFNQIEDRAGLNDSVRLSIEPGPSYLVLFSEKIRIGSPRDEKADIKIQAGGMQINHAHLIRMQGRYELIAKQGPCLVDGEKVDTMVLAAGQELGFGGYFKFDIVAGKNNTLVLETSAMPLPDSSLDGVILMDDRLEIGPLNSSSHVRVPGLKEKRMILRENKKLFLVEEEDKSGLMPGKSADLAGDTQISVSRIE